MIGGVAWPSAAFAITDPPSPLPARWEVGVRAAGSALARHPRRGTVRPGVDAAGLAHPGHALGGAPRLPVQPVAAAPKSGDTPVDHPGASRTPQYTAPTTIQVVRPERTIVRDVDELLPVVLSSAALLIAVGGSALLLAGSIRRRASSNRA